ncbi:MAG: PleD family two-component system response regulator [Alphaproteobacteria bacterium]
MPGRILVVDDVATNRLIARAKLVAAYFDVIEADCGEVAIELAEREQPDLILLDVLMPGIDGFETCRRLKAGRATMHIPVVMLTALDRQADRLRGLDAGADDFLSKPYPDMALFTRVSNLIRMKQMIDELRLRHETSRELGLEGMTSADAGLNFADSSVLLVCACRRLVARAADDIRSRLGCAIETAGGEREARALLASNRYDACVIGPKLTDGEPMRIASLLRARPETRQTSVMMLFPPDDLAKAHLAMEMGVADYLTHPPDFAELTARLKVQLRRKHYSDRLRSSMHDTLVMAVTDPLTGLYNRRYTNNHLESLISRHQPGGRGLATMMLDLDRFKLINDNHGHPAGDEVLREFARRLRENVRGIDLVSRVGGEEFLVVMPDILAENAERVAERVRAAVEETGFTLKDTPVLISVTVSIGLAFHHTGEAGGALIKRADAALYASKNSGRNMVTLAAAA